MPVLYFLGVTNFSCEGVGMHAVPSGEVHKTVFDSVKDIIDGQGIGLVILFALVSIGGAYLKANRDEIKDNYPILFQIICVVLIAMLIFVVWLFFASLPPKR